MDKQNNLIPLIFITAFVANMFLMPFALLWFGTLYSPVDKRKTCYTIATIHSVIIVLLFMKPFMEMTGDSKAGILALGIFNVGIIWTFATGTISRLSWTQKQGEARTKPAIISLAEGTMILIFLLLILFTLPAFVGNRRPAWMSRAKGTLRSTGSSQLAYQRSNIDRNFGSFSGIQHALYIADGYNLGNMIENYSMTWTVYNSPSMSDESSGIPDIHSFTIVAYPSENSPRNLLTFGISEDQVVRVYNPDSVLGLNEYNGLYDPRVNTWDPIL